MTKICSFPDCDGFVTKRGSLCCEHIDFISSFSYECSFCSKIFKPKDHLFRSYLRYLKSGIKYCSRSCNTSAQNSLIVNCEKHGNNQKTFGGKCMKCCNENNNRNYIREQTKKVQVCTNCNKEFNSPIFNNPLCASCSNKERLNKSKILEKDQICSKCNKKFNSIFNMDVCNSCLVTHTNLKNKKKVQLCEECNKEFYSTFIMKTCNSCLAIKKAINNKKKVQLCHKCNKEFHSTFIMKTCHNCSGYGGFNREDFYNSRLKFIEIKMNNKIIEFNDIDDYNNISGVYALWGERETGEKVCLNVCQTINIGRELFRFVRNSNRYKNKSDEDINKTLNSRNNSKRKLNKIKTCRDINNYKNLELVLIAKDIDSKEERENIEMRYAHENKAIFWHPAPG